MVGSGDELHRRGPDSAGSTQLQTEVSALPGADLSEPGDLPGRLGDHLQVCQERSGQRVRCVWPTIVADNYNTTRRFSVIKCIKCKTNPVTSSRSL